MKNKETLDALERGWMDVTCEGELCNPECEIGPGPANYSTNWSKACITTTDGVKYTINLASGWHYYPQENWKIRCPKCSEYFDKNQE